MAEFLVELYVPDADAEAVAQGTERARRAAQELSLEGEAVRCLRSIFVPEDETCFLLYEATVLEDVEEAARRASLHVERISEAIPEPEEARR
jgi:hypothetical protein